MKITLFRKRDFIIIGIFVFIYLVTRLTNLTLLPIFTDEAIYIRWSQIGANDPAWRFISLSDGKQPMFTWIMMIVMQGIHDPLFAGRFVSVLAGLCSLIAIMLNAFILFESPTVMLVAGALYLISPFTLMYDRLAVYDSLVAAFSQWSLFFGILLVKYVRLDIALITGLVLGGGMLNKSSGFLSLYLLPATLLLFNWNTQKRWKKVGIWVILASVAFVLSELMYGVLRLSPLFHMVGLKDAVFVYPFAEWFVHPLRFFNGNLHGLFDWMRGYLTNPIFFLSWVPLGYCLYTGKNWKQTLLLYIWSYAPFIALALFGKVLYPRFILFMAIPLIILASYTIPMIFTLVQSRIARYILVIIICGQAMWTSYLIVINPVAAPIPLADRGQLIDDWPAGGGVREVVSFIIAQSEKGPAAVYTEGTFGLLPYAIEMYMISRPDIFVKGIWPLPKAIPLEIIESSKVRPTYIILNQTQEISSGWPVTLISTYQKGRREDRALRLYKVVLHQE